MIRSLSPGLEVLLKYNTQSALTSQLSDETTLDSSELKGLLTEQPTPVLDGCHREQPKQGCA
jgi:hypothetical protein